MASGKLYLLCSRTTLSAAQRTKVFAGTTSVTLALSTLKQRPAVNHCLGKIFGVGLALFLTKRDVMGRPIILK
jgi:hypothetical protein